MPGVNSLLLTTDAVGGVWQYTCTLVAALRPQGVRCHVAVLGPSPGDAARRDCAAAEIIDTGLKLDWLAETPGALQEAAAQIGALAESRGVAALHLHSPAYVQPGCSLPQIAVAHSCMATWWRALRTAPMPADFAWRTEAFRRGAAAADAVIAPSAAFAAELRATHGIAAEIVHNGIADIARAREVRGSFALAAGRVWDEAKGFDLLDRVARHVAAPICVAGPARGPGGQSFAARHLRLLGTLDRAPLRDAQSRAAMFVAPSRYEPFGLAVLEAAALATPLVLSDIPAFRELWDGAAVLLEARDADAWVRAIGELLADDDRRLELGEAAHRRAQRFTAGCMAERTLRVHARHQRALAA